MESPKRAYSLVEMLVVTAIIAVVAGLIFPSIAAAKGSAREAEEVSHLRQVYVAAELYHADSNDQFASNMTPLVAYAKSRALFRSSRDFRVTAAKRTYPTALPFNELEPRVNFPISYAYLGSNRTYRGAKWHESLVNSPTAGLVSSPWFGIYKQGGEHTSFYDLGGYLEGPVLRIRMDGSYYKLNRPRFPGDGMYGNDEDLYFYQNGGTWAPPLLPPPKGDKGR